MAERVISPAESADTIEKMKQDIKNFLSMPIVKNTVEYMPKIFKYAEEFAKRSNTTVDDRAIVVLETITYLLKGGIDAVIKEM